jgi:tetratricopeptide (TPR) repeat protein
MARLSSQSLSPQEQFAAGIASKEEGNTIYKSGSLKEAIPFYEAAIEFLDIKPEAKGGDVSSPLSSPLSAPTFDISVPIDCNFTRVSGSVVGEAPTAPHVFGASSAVPASDKLDAVEVQKQRLLVMTNLVLAHGKVEEYDACAKYASKVLAEDTDNVKALFWRGIVFENQGNLHKAKRDFKKAHEVNSAATGLGDVSFGSLGKTSNVSKALKRVREKIKDEENAMKAEYRQSFGNLSQYWQ